MFLEKFAKLNTTLETKGDKITINVFDDELENKNPVMWINATREKYEYKEEGIYRNGIYFNIINYNDELFKQLPEKRQDACAAAALKKFIRWYNERYGRDSGEWLPVYAHFVNYKIQEKFEKAVDAGIFPPESLELSELTTEEAWKSEPYYNRENRQTLGRLKEDIKNGNTDGIYIDKGIIVDKPISVVQTFLNKYNMGSLRIEGCLESTGDVSFAIPNISDTDNIASEYGYFAIVNNLLTFDPLDFDPDDSYNEVTPLAIRNATKVKENFDTITTVKFGSRGEEMTLDEWLTPKSTEASEISRLKRKG